jgi:predicted nucleotidyltransferase
MRGGVVALDTVTSAWRVAEQVAGTLSRMPDVLGVLLFGSVARRTNEADSDIDLLVVGVDPKINSQALTSVLPARLRRHHLSLRYFTENELRGLFDAGMSFTEHLRREGIVLYDQNGDLRRIVRSSTQPKVSVDDEIAMQLERLHPLEDWSQYNGNFLFCFSQLYAIGKAVVILALLRSGLAEFDHRRLFNAYRKRYPDRGVDLDTLVGLEPFSRLVSGRPNELPFSYRDAESHGREAVAAIRRLALP